MTYKGLMIVAVVIVLASIGSESLIQKGIALADSKIDQVITHYADK
ncbi:MULTISPECIES: hypothetical protein [Rahnella]|jgi:hypothetical protein|uniref:Uncharacterized protein n=1 Tax=Rahnella sp. (strain Y9602) TaxID=2703885 RepID=A0A0H3FC92_RAHSY|nr:MULTISPECIES: hypothetical protein [Rahnella]AFE57214.1 hypothetical protein Q7S_04810 [Rahnella aquatilis HX2]MDP9704855.1 hypothetical protein [Rahnella aquatilis]MDU8418601.1 hypothetical protein [Pseudomonas syringae]ADW72632.1 hypothetical protein Rahaq_1009 [Rahnella aceris]MBU9840127.1 hypothetical protein [Rahnella aceris]